MRDIGREYGRRLKEQREAMGMTQLEAALAVGIGQTQVSNLENGYTKVPALALAEQFARLYRTSVDYLLGITDSDAPSEDDWPFYARELLIVIEHMSDERRAELLDMANVMVEHERARAETAGTIRKYLDYLAAQMEPGEYQAKLQLIVESIIRGDFASALAVIDVPPEELARYPDAQHHK
jgi:transcriptional regulator with XRE-family HTH domain